MTWPITVFPKSCNQDKKLAYTQKAAKQMLRSFFSVLQNCGNGNQKKGYKEKSSLSYLEKSRAFVLGGIRLQGSYRNFQH